MAQAVAAAPPLTHTPASLCWRACTPAQTAESAQRLAAAISTGVEQNASPSLPPLRIFLSGALGAGKTFWVRALLRAWSYRNEVLSPSYMVAMTYEVAGLVVHHLDCYRLQGTVVDAETRELLEDDSAICVLEWSEHARDLPPPDFCIQFINEEADDHRTLHFTATTARGTPLLEALR